MGCCGVQGVAVLLQNATLRDGAAGLAVSAGYQASAQRFYLYQNRDVIVQPFNVSVADVMQAISNYRDSLDGPTVSPFSQFRPSLYFVRFDCFFELRITNGTSIRNAFCDLLCHVVDLLCHVAVKPLEC